jgi:hypothetical protein
MSTVSGLKNDGSLPPARLRAGSPRTMPVDKYKFGEITIDGVRYEHDLVIAGGKIRKQKVTS